MAPQHIVDKKKLKLRFAVLYTVSVLLMALIFAAVWNTLKQPTPSSIGTRQSVNGMSEESAILGQDELLHAGLMELQKLDENYITFLADGADKEVISSIMQLIEQAEISFNNTLDSIETQKQIFKNATNVAKIDSITSAFRSSLNNRKVLISMHKVSTGGKSNLSVDEKQFLKMQLEIQNKDNIISTLQNEIRARKNELSNNIAISSNNKSNPEIEQLQAEITKEKKISSDLLTQNLSLSKHNNTLTTQVNESRSNNTRFETQDKAERGKTEILQSKITDLNAELILAQVDCNLSRANAKQIISNSRQRKDLLQQSLNDLYSLSNTNNASIQKKVKEKLTELQSILATVRD